MGIFITKQDDSVKSLNAKKLDINFDNDDFFNSFEPVKKEELKKEVIEPKNKYVSKLKEVNDPFDSQKQQQF